MDILSGAVLVKLLNFKRKEIYLGFEEKSSHVQGEKSQANQILLSLKSLITLMP